MTSTNWDLKDLGEHDLDIALQQNFAAAFIVAMYVIKLLKKQMANYCACSTLSIKGILMLIISVIYIYIYIL